ncbi:quinon protein alcohol dehydrogenase-like superfamily [Boletus edulis BED1]|uniref:Quinon protein alcohol dehydrogenase-like superfamily n=1 Tax=Boletus edulis BED1 TaxID=1328754 RepID=A0AAD4G6Q8_BOLED|nr:quinon protein alcohol dehydrogenase-like superfamily [Boletus edulis BED1]
MSSAILPHGSVNDGPRPLLVIPVHDDDHFMKLAYLPDGRRVVAGALAGTVKVWNVENGEQEGTSMESSGMMGLAVTRDGTKFISSDMEGSIKVWDVESHKLIREWTCSIEFPRIAISPDDQFVAAGHRGVQIYSMEGEQVNWSIDVGNVRCMSFSPNGDKLACGLDHGIHVYDVKTGKLILCPLIKSHNGNTKCVLWSHDNSIFFSAGDTICCWNSNTGEQIGHPWTGHTEALSLSPDGSILASASMDNIVCFWDATTGDPIGQHLRHDGSVYDISFSPSGEFVASIEHEKLYLWRVPWWESVQSQINLTDLGAPRNTVHLAQPPQLSPFHPPPPYSTHIPGAEQVLRLDLDDPNTDSPDTSAMSDEVHLQYMIQSRPAPLKLPSAGVNDYREVSTPQSRLSLPPSLNSRMSSSRIRRTIIPYARGPRDLRKRGERPGVSTKGANPHEHEVSSGSSVYDDDDAMDLVYEVEQQPDPPSPTVHSTLPHSRPTSFLAQEPLCGASGLNTYFPPPPDLTRYITKVDDQYVAGGGFGDVFRCRYHDSSPKEVAVKAFRFAFAIDGDASEKSVKMLRRELGIWRRLDHMNIVPFLGVAYGFGMRDAMSLVSLWMPNESLHRFLVKYHDNLDLGHRLRFLLDIANGSQYLHSLAIVHGDLNCNNVLLDADYTARLADFGYASLVGIIPEALTYLRRSTTRPGALRWVAPEQVDPEDPETFKRTTKNDIWSFGCITLQGSVVR